MYFHKWSCTETRNPEKENHLCHLAKPISLPLSPWAKQGVYEHLFLVNNSKNPLHLFLVTKPNPSSWGATYHVSFEKGIITSPWCQRQTLCFHIAHIWNVWQLPLIMNQQGTQAGDWLNKAARQGDWLLKDLVATQHLSKHAPVELKTIAFPLRVVGAGESKTCHSVTHRSASPQSPTTRSQAVIHVQSIPSTFHLPQNTNSELLSVALTQGSMNTKLGMQKPGVHIKPPEFKQASTGWPETQAPPPSPVAKISERTSWLMVQRTFSPSLSSFSPSIPL